MIVAKRGYKTHCRMRVAVKKLLFRLGDGFVEFYEYKIDKNGFRVIAGRVFKHPKNGGVKCLTEN